MNENSTPNQPATNLTPPESVNITPPTAITPNFTSPPVPSSAPAKKLPILIVAILGGVALVSVACVLIFRLAGSPDYGESYRLSVQLETEFEEMWGSSKSSCAAMTSKANDYDITPSDYVKYIDECQQGLVKIWDLSNDLGKSSGITKDPELNQKFTTFENSLTASLPAQNNLEQMKKTFIAIHDFAIHLNTINADSTAAEVNNAAKVLIDSGSDDWANFGREWQTRMLRLLEARRAYEEVKYSDPSYEEVRREYREAVDDLNDYLRNADSEEWDSGGFHVKSIDQLEDNFYDLRSAIRDTYEQHYDGKNPENCTDFDDGEAYRD